MNKKIEVADLLLNQGLITASQLNNAKDEVKRTGLSIERAIEKLGYLSEDDIANVRASALGVPFMDLTDYIIDTDLLQLIPENMAKKYKAVPLFKIGNSLTVAMADPQDVLALDNIRQVSKIDTIEAVLATERGIQRILDSFYGVKGSVKEIAESMEKEKGGEIFEEKDALGVAEDAPIIKLVNVMVMQAVTDRASDIHIEPEESAVRVRYRIDGVLHEANELPKKLQSAITSRIKILAKMDIAENRKPQDGRIRMKTENKTLDIRVSTFPTVHGENVVMRLLDKTSVLLGLKELGLVDVDLGAFDKLIRHPNGIILVTGPTGSGKTTTLYAALTSINSTDKNIITLEDPVEYELPLIRQTSVNPKAGITFATGLRSILRQDPDIIMVGEIRDKETADIAIQASLTGHLVFSTLHTNDAASSLTRLIDMDIEPFLISSSVIGILAQRLIRTLCDKCREKYTPTEDILKDLGIKESAGLEFYRSHGCSHCKNTGYLGRIGIFELLLVNEEIRKMVNSKKSADEIKKKAIESGMRTLRDDGLDKVRKGITTVDEILRVTELQD